jgi:hypothetical protein
MAWSVVDDSGSGQYRSGQQWSTGDVCGNLPGHGRILSGLFGTGGPPLILYFPLSGITKVAFRGSLMALFLLISEVRLPVYSIT